MKNAVIVAALLAFPSITFAGGAGNMSYLDTFNNAKSGVSSLTGSTEAPASILESRQVIGSENENYVKYSFSYIPKSYWESQAGTVLSDANGSIELEEYLGETERSAYDTGDDLSREAERQARAKSKALRLRTLYR